MRAVLRRVAYVFAFLAGAIAGLWMLSEGEYRHRIAQNRVDGLHASIADEQRMDQATHDAHFKKFSEMLPVLLRQLPDAWPTPAMEQEIRTLAENHDLASPTPKIGTEQPGEFHVAMRYVLETSGRTDELLGFVADLSRGDAPLRQVNALVLDPNNDAGKLTDAKIYITYYRWLPEPDAPAKAD